MILPCRLRSSRAARSALATWRCCSRATSIVVDWMASARGSTITDMAKGAVVPHVTDISEQSQSKTFKKSFRMRKNGKKFQTFTSGQQTGHELFGNVGVLFRQIIPQQVLADQRGQRGGGQQPPFGVVGVFRAVRVGASQQPATVDNGAGGHVQNRRVPHGLVRLLRYRWKQVETGGNRYIFEKKSVQHLQQLLKPRNEKKQNNRNNRTTEQQNNIKTEQQKNRKTEQ